MRVRFEIKDSKPGQTWQLFLSDNGGRISARTKVSDEGGEVRVRKVTTDREGSDRIKATAVNLDTAESCSGSLTYSRGSRDPRPVVTATRQSRT